MGDGGRSRKSNTAPDRPPAAVLVRVGGEKFVEAAVPRSMTRTWRSPSSAGAAFNRGVGRDRVGAGIALLVVEERHVYAGLPAIDDRVRDADPGAFVQAGTEVGVEGGVPADGVDERVRVPVDREPRHIGMPVVVVGEQRAPYRRRRRHLADSEAVVARIAGHGGCLGGDTIRVGLLATFTAAGDGVQREDPGDGQEDKRRAAEGVGSVRRVPPDPWLLRQDRIMTLVHWIGIRELRRGEGCRTLLPRTRVHKGKKRDRGCVRPGPSDLR